MKRIHALVGVAALAALALPVSADSAGFKVPQGNFYAKRSKRWQSLEL